MYEQLDMFLNDFASDNIAILNYWYDGEYEEAIEMIEQFTEEDWQKLLENYKTKSDFWKERLAYCFVDKDNHYQLQILEDLLNTENNHLFAKVIDELRVHFDVKRISNIDEVLKKIDKVLPLLDKEWARKSLLDFKSKATKQSRDLKIFTDNIEERARKQIDDLLDQDAFKESKVRIMPDVHAGKSCVIGFTGDLGKKVIPNIVGVDIGCGMFCAQLGKIDIDYEKLDSFINSKIPNGLNVNEEPVIDFDLTQLYCYKYLKNTGWISKSLGSLGGGNHFIEIDESEDGEKYLVIHSGSRNLGAQVAHYYQTLANEICNHGLFEHDKRRQEIIEKCKKEGREKDIQTELEKLNIEYQERKGSIPPEYAYLEGEYRDAYLHDMKICQEFAKLNRYIMAKRIATHMGWNLDNYFESVHNYISFEDNIVRKGAISAKEGEPVIIPINMRDGCIIGVGKGNPDWNYSAPHGAGRIMSRSQAMEKISLEDYQKSMEGIYTSSISEDTKDEAPFVYKSKEEILEHIIPSVTVTKVIKPVYNFKASEVQMTDRKEEEESTHIKR